MTNYLKECLGTTGHFEQELTQAEHVKKVFLSKGACAGICAEWMCKLSVGKMAKLQQSLEVSQWLHSDSSEMGDRLTLLTDHFGLKVTGGTKGMLTYDDLKLSMFLEEKTISYSAFFMFGVDNTMRTSGHELLIFTGDRTSYGLVDPNFGVAIWPRLGGLMVGLKKLLKMGEYGTCYGPYFPFDVIRYQWAS